MAWFCIKYPDVIADGPQTQILREAVQVTRANGLSPDDKATFLEMFGQR